MQYRIIQSNEKNRLIYAWFPAMFTRVDIVLITDDQSINLIEVVEEIEVVIGNASKMTNRFDDSSELSGINKNAFSEKQPVSRELFQIISDCLQYHQLTLGYFDITINSANAFTDGMSNILLNQKDHSIRFLHPDVQLDLSGFIKGYVLRAVRHVLQIEKINNAMINLGNSSVLATGNHPQGTGWKVQLTENPSEEILLNDQYLTTSGNIKNRKWPVCNPHTHEVMEDDKLVWVKTFDPAAGEALSKALLIAGEDKQQQIIRNFKQKNIYITHKQHIK